MYDLERNDLIGLIAIIIGILVFFGMLIGFSFADNQKQRVTDQRQMEVCVNAGGTWLDGNCINDGWQP